MTGTAPAADARRICLICEVLHAPFDEGIRIFAASLARALAPGRELLLVSDRDSAVGEVPVHGVLANRYFLSARLARLLRSFDPDAILYVPWTSLTARTLFRIWMIRRYAPHARMGVVALQPRAADALAAAAARIGRPHMAFAAGPGVEAQARRLGIPVTRVRAGVDVARFRPASGGEREMLRQRAGIAPDAFVLLHVGHLKGSRNVAVLGEAARLPGVRCVLVASTSTLARDGAGDRLAAAGVMVMARHQERIEVVYRLADAYLFPVTSPLDAIEMPLSVLEAAATDLTIISTRFGGLPDLLGGASGQGVIWTSSSAEMVAAVRDLSTRGSGGTGSAGTRRLVEALTWEGAAAAVLAGMGGRR